ncbi:hypothetical protein M433DRAFT_71380, partial [Acidomyces richmondensis BFW]
PFTGIVRHISDTNVKSLWWYPAEIQKGVQRDTDEAQFEPMLIGFDKAMQQLVFKED